MGRGIAEAALAAGGEVIVTSRTTEKAEKTASEIGARAIAADLTQPQSIKALFESVGPLDHLAITAGATGRASFSATPPGEARTFMDEKLWATHHCLWTARPFLNDTGSIMLLSGGYADTVTDEAGHVHVTFHAVEAMARAAAVAFAPLRCNVIRPGFVDTALWDFMDDAERNALRDQEKSRTLTQRLVSPREFGDAVVAIMTASAITGATIPVDGGRHLWRA